MKRIVITGTESTGKTELTSQLAAKYQFKLIPEYARTYIENLNSPYDLQDVINIAQKQVDQYNKVLQSGESVFFDTWLIITKVWLKVVYDAQVDWIDSTINERKIDLFILCSNDLPWVADSVRENGGEMRSRLFEIYRNELEKHELPYRVISGLGEERLKNAIFTIEDFFKNR